MVKDDLLPLTALIAPPDGIDEAVCRVSNLVGDHSRDCLVGLIGAVFESVDQFRLAMQECGLNMRTDVLMDGGRVKTHKATVITARGAEYKMILNEIGPRHMTVINARLIKPAPGTEEQARDVNRVLEDRDVD